MSVDYRQIGEPVHDAEESAIRYVVEGLEERDEHYVVWSNIDIPAGGNRSHEHDLIVIGPRTAVTVELKAFSGEIRANNEYWIVSDDFTPRTPVPDTKQRAKELKGLLQGERHSLRSVWVQGLVFVSGSNVEITGEPRHLEIIRTRGERPILDALVDPSVTGTRKQTLDPQTREQIDEIISGRSSESRERRQFGDYELKRELSIASGERRSYDAWLAEHRFGGHERELHIYHLKGDAKRFKKQIQKQCNLLQELAGIKEVVRTFDPETDDQDVVIRVAVVFESTEEYMSLRSFMREHEELSLRKRLLVLERLLEPLARVHAHDVIHQRLSPQQILVHRDDVLDHDTEELTAEKIADLDIKIGGFEKVREAGTEFTRMTSVTSDPRYRYSAPEIVSHDARTRACDVFSFGVIAAEVLTGERQVTSEQRARTGEEMPPLTRGDRPLDPDLDDFVRSCAAAERADRPDSLIDARDEFRELVDRFRRTSERPTDPFAPGAKLAGDYEVYEKLSMRPDHPTLLVEELQTNEKRVLKLMRIETQSRLKDILLDLGLKHAAGNWRVNLAEAHPVKVDGTPAFVFDYVEGIGGREFAKARKGAEAQEGASRSAELLDRELFRTLGEELFEALGVLHRPEISTYHHDHGHDEVPVFLHRDVKPHNVVLTVDEEEPEDSRLVIVDPALITTDEDPETPGTSAYKPREVDDEGWTVWADTAAAVMTLFEIVTGHHPYGRKRPAEDRLDLTVDDETFDGILNDGEVRRFVAFCEKWLDGTVRESHGEPDAVHALEDFRSVLEGDEQQSLIVDEIDAPTARLQADLLEDERPIQALGLAPTLVAELRDCGYETVGEIAGAGRGILERKQDFESDDVDEIHVALRRFAERVEADLPGTAEELWAGLEGFLGEHAEVLDLRYGLSDGRRLSAKQVAESSNFSQVGVSEAKVRELLEEAWERFEGGLGTPGDDASGHPVVDWFHTVVETHLPTTGIVEVDGLADALADDFPVTSDAVSSRGLARLGVVLIRLNARRVREAAFRDTWMSPDELDGEVAPLAPWTQSGFEAALEAVTEAVGWPPVERETLVERATARLLDEHTELLRELDESEITLDDVVRQFVELSDGLQPSGFGGIYRPADLGLADALEKLRDEAALPLELDEATDRLARWFPGADLELDETSVPALHASGLALVDDMLVDADHREDYVGADEEPELDDDVKVAHVDVDAEAREAAEVVWTRDELPGLDEGSDVLPEEAPEIVRSLWRSIDGGVMRILSLLPREHKSLAEALIRELRSYLADDVVQTLDVDRYLLERLRESEDGEYLFELEREDKLDRQLGFLREQFKDWMEEKLDDLEPGTLTLWYNPCLLVEVGDPNWLGGLYERLRTTPAPERGLLVLAVPGTVRHGQVLFNESRPVFAELEMAPVAVREV